jgi:carbon monoxide dehydrogenase subunit G
MNIHDEFRVGVPVTEAWNVFLDVERIAPCMPGAQLQEVEGDEYRGTVKVKVGPITAQYKGAARILEADEAARRIVLKGDGRDTRGQGNASATVTVDLADDGDGTRVTVDTDLNVTGKVAQFGRGVMADVSAKLLAQFVSCLETTVLASGGADANPGPTATEPERAVAAPPPTETPESPVAPGGVRKIDAPEAVAVDLMKVAGGAVAKRAVPALVVLAVVIGVAIWLLTK